MSTAKLVAVFKCVIEVSTIVLATDVYTGSMMYDGECDIMTIDGILGPFIMIDSWCAKYV